METKSAFRLELEEVVQGRFLARHPMYVAWSRGDLSRRCMAGSMIENYHYVTRIYSAFFLIAAQGPPDVIEMEIENYHDEMNPEKPHPELFLRFIKACGGDPEAVKRGRGLPSTEFWTEWLIDLARNEPWQAAVAAIHIGSEFQAPGTIKSILPALREIYKFAEHDIEHFWLHAEVDVHHSGTAFEVLERHCRTGEQKDMVKHYVAESVRRRWFFIDCIYLHYEKNLLS